MNNLPDDWNKSTFFVTINPIPKNFFQKLFPKERFYGYIWPTDNWVEVHCFEEMNQKNEYTFNQGTETVNIMTEMHGQQVPTPRIMTKAFLSDNTYFENRKKSFIISREKVFFNGNDVIFCDPEKEDFDRWKEWHPNDDYQTFFEGEEKTWYFAESHQGITFVQEIFSDNTLGSMKNIGEY